MFNHRTQASVELIFYLSQCRLFSACLPRFRARNLTRIVTTREMVNKNEDKINKINKYAYQRRAIHARVKVQPFFYFLFFKLYINMSLSIRFIQNLTSKHEQSIGLNRKQRRKTRYRKRKKEKIINKENLSRISTCFSFLSPQIPVMIFLPRVLQP